MSAPDATSGAKYSLETFTTERAHGSLENQAMPLRPEELPGNAIAVFPFLKTVNPISIGSFTFRSTEDTSHLDAEDRNHVAEITSMLFLKDDLRIRSASYALLPPLNLDRPSVPWRFPPAMSAKSDAFLRELEHLQAIVAYCYSAPHDTFGLPFLRFEHSSLVIFSPEPVFADLARPEHHVDALNPREPLTRDNFGRVIGFRGLYNFRQHFWATEGSRCYPPVPHLGLNISQNLCSDLHQCFFDAPQHRLLPELLREPVGSTAERVLMAITWYNRANSLVSDDHAAIVDLAIAFETLLGLPQEAKKEQLNSALFLLLGRTPRLPDWEKQFYAARSQVVHSGRASQLQFVPVTSKNAQSPYRDLLTDGRQFFQLCVGTLLFGAFLAERAGLADKMVPNQERFEQMIKMLDSDTLSTDQKLSDLDKIVRRAVHYRFVNDPSLQDRTLIGAAQRAAKLLLTASAPSLPTSVLEAFQKLADAPKSGDGYEALDALRLLNESGLPALGDPNSPHAVIGRLTALVWQYTFSQYYWLSEKRRQDHPE
jgi:hypothetical protein